ncbi:hypothetical protein CNR22_20325 [Sphingobacteriaceae bacterium]|nr:hypothetical protein CNR22_20325 [Sphingobacteriaceae bacterium]
MTRELEIQFQERSIRALLSEMEKISDFLRRFPELETNKNPDFTDKEIMQYKTAEFKRLGSFYL